MSRVRCRLRSRSGKDVASTNVVPTEGFCDVPETSGFEPGEKRSDV